MLEERRPRTGDPGESSTRETPEVANGAAPDEAVPADVLPADALPAGGAAPGGARAELRVWRDPVTWVIASCVFGAYLVISLYRLFQLNPSSWDLGIFTEYVKQYSMLRAPIVDVRGPGFNLLGDHFQVIVALVAPFFRMFPSPVTLLVAQAALTAVSVFPVVTAGAALLGKGTGRALGFAYGFSWGLQQMINFDFHEIAFAVPLLAFTLSALVRGRARAAMLWALPLVIVKEDQGFTVAAIGVVMALAGTRGWRLGGGPDSPQWRREATWSGLFLVCWGLGWSLLEIGVLIPAVSATGKYGYWNLGGVVGGGPSFSVGGLALQMGHAYPVKVQTLVMLLLPVAFIALGSPLAAIAVPSLLLRFIATNDYYWSTDWHYNATVMPILFLAAIEAMARWRAAADGLSGAPEERGSEARAVLAQGGPPGAPGAAHSAPPSERGLVSGRAGSMVRGAASRHGAAMMVALAVALAFQYPLSNLWHGSTYQVSSHAVADEAAMAVVPDGATVTTTLNLLAPLAARTDTFWVGNAGNPDTQYIVFDGPNSGYTPPVANVPAFIQQQLYPKAGYQVVFEDDGVFVFKRP